MNDHPTVAASYIVNRHEPHVGGTLIQVGLALTFTSAPQHRVLVHPDDLSHPAYQFGAIWDVTYGDRNLHDLDDRIEGYE